MSNPLLVTNLCLPRLRRNFVCGKILKQLHEAVQDGHLLTIQHILVLLVNDLHDLDQPIILALDNVPRSLQTGDINGYRN